MSHTPGPWAEPYLETAEGDGGWWIHNGKQGSEEFAVTFVLNPNAEADARLIAAAPDLLEAARESVKVLERMDTLRHVDPAFPALDKCRAAIAKAEGK